MSIPTPSNKKYRPYFTISELQEISLCLKSHPTPARLSLVQYLERFIIQINHGIITTSYSPNPRPTLSQKLGFSDTGDVEVPISHEITGEMAYQKHLISPATCTPKEIAEAMEYRYTHDLMSKQEEEQYEQSLFSSNGSSSNAN